MKRSLLLAALCACSQFNSIASAQIVNGVFSQEEAQRHGLKRAWFVQADVDSSGKIVDLTLDRGTLFVQTGRGILQAIDAESGQTIWSAQVGNARYPSMACAANEQFIATINGSTVYILDRKTGHEIWNRPLDAPPGAGPAISNTHVFIPMVNGTINGFHLTKRKAIPWFYKSFGRILVQPIVTSATLSWTTEEGYLYLMSLSDPDHLQVNRRLETNDKIESRPGYWTPYLYGVSLDGYAYAVNEKTGKIDWKYSTAVPLVETPVAVAGKVYVCAERGGMYCLDGTTGVEDWFAPNIMQFISVSPTRVYTADRLGRLNVLDAKTGGRVDVVPMPDVTRKFRNTQSDRLYLTNKRGTIQCLREAELTKPVVYSPPPLEPKEKPKTTQKKLAEEPVAEEAEEAPAEEAPDENPFGEGAAEEPAEEMPAEEPAADDENPFG